MARNWTPAQSAAMSTLGRTLLISAAAGSGKTATLTERIIRRLTDPQKPAELSRMLIVTFTRAAAGELKERIAKALSEAIARDPGNRHLQKQYMGLGGAHISTIDAFCREPVKEHFAEIGLPATSRIADEAELKPLRDRVMGELIDEFYLKYADPAGSTEGYGLLENNLFADLCDSLTPFKNDTELIPTLLSLYDRLLSFPEELERLKWQADEMSVLADRDFFESAHGGIIRDWVREFLTPAIAFMEDAMEILDTDPAAFKAYHTPYQNDLDTCLALARANTYAEARAVLLGYSNIRLGNYKGGDPDVLATKEGRTNIYKTLNKLRDAYFTTPPETISLQTRITSDMCRVLYEFLSEYDRRILAEKKSRGICDFTDNRRYLLSLLRDPDGSPSAMAKEFAARFDEVYIDEYQDVDEMQDEIFRLVGQDHRFMVGDIKQSIYVFRGADPSVFARYRRELSTLEPNTPSPQPPAGSGSSIFMSDNFRCDESVIRVTNAVCGHVFRACPDTVGYRDEDDLGFSKSKPTPTYQPNPVQVTVLTKPSKSEEEAAPPVEEEESELAGVGAEAAYVAAEIAELLRSGTLADGKPIRPSDIVILMRGRKALAPYMEALTALRIPTGSEELETAEAGRDLLQGSDMSYLVNLLRVMDNPDNDIPLSEVLRAPFPGLTLEELITLRNEGDPLAESHSLYAGCEAYLERADGDPVLTGKLTAFMVWLERYRSLATTHPADGLLRMLRQDENCASRESAAFLFLYESARTCRTSSFLSLCVFLRYFENKLKTQKRAPIAADDREGGHVSIMTIHSSKGLEFPVCFVVRCGQSFLHKTQGADLLFDKRAGVAMKIYSRADDPAGNHRIKTDTVLRTAAALSVKLTEREEEMRLLYVAMTRARERLYLVGMGNETPVRIPAGDRFATMGCNNYLKWILAGLDAHPEVAPFVDLRYISTSSLSRGVPLTRIGQGLADPARSGRAAYYRAILENRPERSQLDSILTHIPTTLPASRMTEHLLDTCVFFETDIPENQGKLPDSGVDGVRLDVDSEATVRAALSLMASTGQNEFELLLAAGRRPTAAEKGTATHLFLQYCDYGLARTQGLEAEITRLTELGFLNERTARILDRGMLESFFASRFFAHMGEATRIQRELKFNRLVPLSSLTEIQSLSELLEGRMLMVRGSVDLLCEFSDGHLELCDYKTDHITPEERKDPSLLVARMTEAHRQQLLQYAAAITEMYGKAPTRAFIFSLPLGEALEIPL